MWGVSFFDILGKIIQVIIFSKLAKWGTVWKADNVAWDHEGYYGKCGVGRGVTSTSPAAGRRAAWGNPPPLFSSFLVSDM